MQNGQKLCPNCKKLVKDEKICPHCGFVLDKKLTKLDEAVGKTNKPSENLNDKVESSEINIDPSVLNKSVLISTQESSETSTVKNTVNKSVSTEKADFLSEDNTEEATISEVSTKKTSLEGQKEEKNEDAEDKVENAETRAENAEAKEKVVSDVSKAAESITVTTEEIQTKAKNEENNVDENTDAQKEKTEPNEKFTSDSKLVETANPESKPNEQENKQEITKETKKKKESKTKTEKDNKKSKDQEEANSKEAPNSNKEVKKQISSLFDELVPDDFQPIKKEHTTKAKKVVPLILALILFVIAAFAYYKFYYITPDYIVPMVLSSEDQQAFEIQKDTQDTNIPIAMLNSLEKTLDLQLPLKEGNFEKNNLLIFAPDNLNMAIHLFDLQNLFKTYVKSDLLENLQKDYAFTDDDLKVYLSDGYALLFPNNDLKTWGYVAEIKDVDFVKKRVDQFNKDSEKENFKYKGYYVEIVEVSKNKAKGLEDIDFEQLQKELNGQADEKGTDESNNADKEKDIDTESESTSTETKDNTKTNSKAQEKTSENTKNESDQDLGSTNESENNTGENKDDTENSTKYYLIFSNSKEFLDQMKESTEGNLPNLTDNILFVDVKKELPILGQAFVFKQNNETYQALVDFISPQINYEGIDKILQSIKSSGFVVLPKGEKTKIIQTER